MGLIDQRAQILDHSSHIVPHLVVPIAHDPKPFSLTIGRSRGVARIFVMLAAIDFNDEAQFAAEEVADERPDRHLAGKLPAAELAPVEVAP